MKNPKRFIKFLPSEVTDWLREKHPYAFLLLSLIAERARRCSGHPDGLEIGDALIGDFRKSGIPTEAIYRTAKNTLVKIKAIKIKETNRNPLKKNKISTNRITTTGTLVTLLNSDVWDINPAYDHESNNDSIASKQRFSNEEQEGKKKEKKMKKESLQKPKNTFKF
jgi:hypothetical protein